MLKKLYHHHVLRFIVLPGAIFGMFMAFPHVASQAASFLGITRFPAQGTVTASSDLSAPSTVNNLASADTFNPALMPPCGPVTLYPMIASIGITITSPVVGTDHATIRYRARGAQDWIEGHDAVLTNTGQVVGSLFWLSAETTYDVEVTSRTSSGVPLTVNMCTGTTQPEAQTSTIAQTLYVSASALAGGNGSLGQPFTTIQAAVTIAQPGDQIIIQPGIYHEGVLFPRSGQPGAYIKVVGQPGAILDGGDPTIEQAGLSWIPDGTYPNVYSTTLPPGFYHDWYLLNDPIWRDTQHFYTFENVDKLRTGTGHWDTPIDEGWYYDSTTRLLTIRSLTDPASHTWHIRSHDMAFGLYSRDYIWIEGVTIRYYPMGIYIPSGAHNIIKASSFQSENGILMDNSQGQVAEGNRIEGNTFFDTPLADWGYNAVKGTAMETGAIVTWQGVGTIIRDNRIEQHHNGIFTGDSTNVDVYRNVIRHLSDDGLEFDGTAENIRAWGNAVDDINSGLSLAPTTVGPVWALYNRFTQFQGRAFKIGGGLTGGIDFLYHNTVVSTTSGSGTQQVTNDTNRIVFRNNIFSTSGVAIRWTDVMPGVDMDHDNVYSIAPQPILWFHAGDTYLRAYQNVTGLCAFEVQECHGSSAPSQLVNPSNNQFGLQPTSPNIDSAMPIPGINHIYSGAGPDRGYLEYGQPEISW